MAAVDPIGSSLHRVDNPKSPYSIGWSPAKRLPMPDDESV